MRAIRLASNIICSAMTLGAYGLGFFLSIATAFYLFDQWPSLWGIAVGMLFWIVVLLSLPIVLLKIVRLDVGIRSVGRNESLGYGFVISISVLIISVVLLLLSLLLAS